MGGRPSQAEDWPEADTAWRDASANLRATASRQPIGTPSAPGRSPAPAPRTTPPTVLAEGWAEQTSELGLWLLGELNCTACHAAPEPLQARLLVRPAPDLQWLAGKRMPGYIRRYLAAPHAARPGTLMPDLLTGLPAAERDGRRDAVSAFLESLGQAASSVNESRPALRVAQGRVLYHQVGCLACHPAFEPAAAVFGAVTPATENGPPSSPASLPQAWPSVDLHWVGEAWMELPLAGFLEDPGALRRDSRMPALGLTPDEARAIASYLIEQTQTRGEKQEPTRQGAPEALVEQGRLWFGEMGCGACHVALAEDLGLATRPRGRPLTDLDPTAIGGCLADLPAPGLPRYALSPSQGRALVDILGSDLSDLAQSTPDEALHQLLATFNCLACHVREDQGGPRFNQADYFRSRSEADLGDEGRLPPRLDQAGAKLRPDWLQRVLRESVRPRPYLVTRMPLWGAERAAALDAAFAAADRGGPFASKPPESEFDPAIGAGLVGLEGCGCVTCHRLQGRPGWTLSAMDLAWTTHRLEWSWFRKYLEDPIAWRPGTRMPSFWPGGRAAIANVLGGDAEAQIRAVWTYLATLPLPDSE